MRRAVERHWPAFLVGAACAGLSASNWIAIEPAVGTVVVLAAMGGTMLLGGSARVAALAVALTALGLVWGSLRLDALEHSVLAESVGESGRFEAVTTAPARVSPWATKVQATTLSFDRVAIRERALVVLPAGRSPPRGSLLELEATIEEPRPAEGGFDERAWLSRQGIHVVLRASSWRPVGRRGGIAGLGDRLRDRVEDAVSSGTTGVRRGIVLGVVLGEDEGLPASVRDDFRASGLTHLLAVSGQNVAFIVAGIQFIGWLLGISRIGRELAVLVSIAVYVLVVGWQPSVVRAGVAGALVSLAWLAARPRDRWHFLAVGALVLLLWTPTSLLDPGFQLSFAAVAAIFVAVPRVREAAAGWPLPSAVIDALAVSVACGLVTAPIVLVHFDRAPLYTVVANALAFPAMPAVLALGLLAAAAGLVSPDAATALAWLAGWAGAWLALVARVIAAIPGAQVDTRGALALGVVVALGWPVARRARRRLAAEVRVAALAGALLALVVVAAWWVARPGPAWTQPTGLRVTFLDVGQGDSVLLETASARVLVDEGPPEADVAGQLSRMGVRSLSALVLTHPQRDHVGGAAAVLRRLHVGVVLDPALTATGPEREEAIAVARQQRVRVREVRAGDELRAGGLVLRVLWPADSGSPSEDPNLNAVVLLASFGETDVLLPADAESDVTARLDVGEVELLKVAHHGSADPGLVDELRELRPEVAVISCGQGNEYGHPRPETLSALGESRGTAVYRTDLDGRVVVESDGRRLRVRFP